MKKVWEWIKNNPNRTMFLIPILLVAGISISHVVSWYDIANPISWAIYLSIAIEVGAMTALVAATNKIRGGVWFMFGMVTFVQMIGNIFFSYKEIDANGDLFKSWVELTGPVWESFGSDTSDIISMKRWLAFLEGGLLPIISLTSLHFFVNYDGGTAPQVTPQVTPQVEENIEKKNDISDQLEVINESKKDNIKEIVENEVLDLPKVPTGLELENNLLPSEKVKEITPSIEPETTTEEFSNDEIIENTTTEVATGVTTKMVEDEILEENYFEEDRYFGSFDLTENNTNETTTTTEFNSRKLKYTKGNE